MYTNTQAHAHKHTHAHTSCTCMNVCTLMHVHTDMPLYTQTCKHTCIHIHTHSMLQSWAPALWGCHFLSPPHPRQGQQRSLARHSDALTFLTLRPEIQWKKPLPGIGLEQGWDLRGPFHNLWGQPQVSAALSRGNSLK